ncbi:MAG: acyl-CoA dehydrogenase family protein [Firmicutes bacterium]|nr:acyl-CoA dehydrogenase family protein [Bacillota bacterium]
MFELTREQKMLQKMAHDFSVNELEPIADEVDKSGEIPHSTIEKIAKTGLFTLTAPKEYGGGGWGDVEKVLVVKEIAKACGSTGEMYAVHLLVVHIINKFGTEEQKRKYFALSNEGKIGAFALTESEAGSDAGGLRTTATEDGDYYVLNGSKTFISNMGPKEGDFVIVFALTDKEKKTHGGITAFIVDRGTPGFELGKLEDKMGIRGAAVSELIFEDCRVPKSNIIGEVGKGFNVAMGGLDSGRVGISAQSCGIAEAAFEEALEYAKTRKQFGKPIAANQGLSWYLAEMGTKLEAANLLSLRAADAAAKGEDATKLGAMAKFFASETANEIAAKALQIHGGYGFMRDYKVERLYRDARILTIYEGSSEIQKLVIARNLIGR